MIKMLIFLLLRNEKLNQSTADHQLTVSSAALLVLPLLTNCNQNTT